MSAAFFEAARRARACSRRFNSSVGHLLGEYGPPRALVRSEIRYFDQLDRFECVHARSFSQGELGILSQRGEATIGADWTSMLAGEKREACSIYPYGSDGGEADRADERALSPTGKKNRQDSTKTTHRLVIRDRLSQLPA